MSESNMRSELVRLLHPLGAFAVENPAYPGTPDIYYIEGWIECKWLREWPKRADTPVKLDHYTKQQRFFSKHHAAHGGLSWVMLRCKRHWLLFEGTIAAQHLGKDHATQPFLEEIAYAHWSKGIDPISLIRILTNNRKA